MDSKDEMTSDQDDKPSIGQVLTNATFMVLFAAQFIENIGRSISGLAIEFLIFGLTGSPLLMGVLSIIWLLPFVIIAPLAGVLADRFDQRKLMLISNIVSAIASVGFVIVYALKDQLTLMQLSLCQPAAIGSTAFIATIPKYIHVLWPLFVLCFINSSSAAFFFPSRNAYTRLIVRKKNLLIANSVGSSVFQVATITGFMLAGFLAARSYLLSFIFDAVTFAVSGVLIAVIFIIGKKPPEVVREKSQDLRQELKSFGEDIVKGYRTIQKHPKISYMLVLFSFLTFALGAVSVLFIVILQGEMGVGEEWYGVLQALMGISGIITALVFMKIGKIKRKILLLNITFVILTATMYLFSTVRNLTAMAIIMLSYGIMMVCINVPASTLIQESVPYKLQGRVFGSQQLLQGVAQLLGMGIVSIIAEYVLPMWVLLACSAMMTVTIITGFFYSKKKGLMGSDYLEEKSIDLLKAKIETLPASGGSPSLSTEKE